MLSHDTTPLLKRIRLKNIYKHRQMCIDVIYKFILHIVINFQRYFNWNFNNQFLTQIMRVAQSKFLWEKSVEYCALARWWNKAPTANVRYSFQPPAYAHYNDMSFVWKLCVSVMWHMIFWIFAVFDRAKNRFNR